MDRINFLNKIFNKSEATKRNSSFCLILYDVRKNMGSSCNFDGTWPRIVRDQAFSKARASFSSKTTNPEQLEMAVSYEAVFAEWNTKELL